MPIGVMFATIIASVASAAFVVWGSTVIVVGEEAALAASVGQPGPSLSMTGHVVFLSFGGIIGLVTAMAIIALSEATPVRHPHSILPFLATAISSLAALGCLWFVAGIFFSPPRELMDLLIR